MQNLIARQFSCKLMKAESASKDIFNVFKSRDNLTARNIMEMRLSDVSSFFPHLHGEVLVCMLR